MLNAGRAMASREETALPSTSRTAKRAASAAESASGTAKRAASAAESASSAAASAAPAESAAASAAERLTAEHILQLDVLRGLGLAAHGGQQPERDLDFIEVFAGEAAVTKALRAMGYAGACMDLRRDARHNVLQPVGFITLLGLVMRLRPRGLLWLAPVCSTWVFMSRGSTGRRELRPGVFVFLRFNGLLPRRSRDESNHCKNRAGRAANAGESIRIELRVQRASESDQGHVSLAGWWDSSPYILGQNALSCRMAAVCLLVADLAARLSGVRVLSVCVWRAGLISVLVLPCTARFRLCACVRVSRCVFRLRSCVRRRGR